MTALSPSWQISSLERALGSQLFDQAERGLHVCSHRSTSIEFVLRDYELLDGAMAHMVELMGLRITDYDTEHVLTDGPEGDATGRVPSPCRAAPGQ